MYIKKRDGSIVEFDPKKINIAINKAYDDVGGGELDVDGYQLMTSDVQYEINEIVKDATVYATSFSDEEPVTVEQMQDFVELHLMSHKLFAIAKSYIRYRYKREVARNNTHEFIGAIEDKIEAKNVQNQNANVDEMSFGGRVGEATDFIMKKYALEHCVSEKLRYNHENNRIYTHDLSAYAVGSHNCLTIPFDDLLKTGFNTRQTDVRPANSVNTAFQLLAVIFQLQSLQQFGGVAASHLDWTMVPYVRKSFCKHLKKGLKYIDKKDDMFINMMDWNTFKETPITSDIFKQFMAYDYAIDEVEKEVYQAAEGMFHNLNILG